MADKSLEDDLDYLRTLAEAGEKAPLLGGRFYILWGGIIGVAYLIHYLIASGMVGSHASFALLWPVAIGIGLCGHVLITRRFVRTPLPGGGSAGNQTSMFVWQFTGICMFALFGGLIGRTASGIGTAAEFDWSIPIIFAFYSIALGTSGSMAQSAALKGAAGLSALVFAGAILLVGRAELYLLAAAGITLTGTLPGVILLRKEPELSV